MNYWVNFAEEIRRAANNGKVEPFSINLYKLEGLPFLFAKDKIVEACQIHNSGRTFVWLERRIPAALFKTCADFLGCFAEKMFPRCDILKLRDVLLQKTKKIFVPFYAEDGNLFGGFDYARGVSDICSDVNHCEGGKLLFHQRCQPAEQKGLLRTVVGVPLGGFSWYLN